MGRGDTMVKNEKLYYTDVFVKLHNEVYKKMNQRYIDVFLCGGASNKKTTSIRDRIRDGFKEFDNIRILYPEDLFIEMLNKNKDYDLLSLERFLADNCDIICIVCESAGSLVELGAFTNNENTVDKVVALIEEKRKKQKSFIMLGPVKILKKISKERVIFFNDNLDGINVRLIKTFEKKLKKSNTIIGNREKPINTLLGLYYFIQVVLYFFKNIDIDVLMSSLKYLFEKQGYDIEDFDTLFRPSLKLLYKDKLIIKNVNEGKMIYTLTEKGYMQVNIQLSRINIKNKNILFDGIRFGIIRNEYYRSF
jgi:hypothetical protein